MTSTDDKINISLPDAYSDLQSKYNSLQHRFDDVFKDYEKFHNENTTLKEKNKELTDKIDDLEEENLILTHQNKEYRAAIAHYEPFTNHLWGRLKEVEKNITNLLQELKDKRFIKEWDFNGKSYHWEFNIE